MSAERWIKVTSPRSRTEDAVWLDVALRWHAAEGQRVREVGHCLKCGAICDVYLLSIDAGHDAQHHRREPTTYNDQMCSGEIERVVCLLDATLIIPPEAAS